MNQGAADAAFLSDIEAPSLLQGIIMKKNVDVEKLIRRFANMAKRGTLLTGNVSQEDLLTQIIGTIVVEANTEEEEQKECDASSSKGEKPTKAAGIRNTVSYQDIVDDFNRHGEIYEGTHSLMNFACMHYPEQSDKFYILLNRIATGESTNEERNRPL